MILTESRFQNWRALGIEQNGTEHLLYLGMSIEQLRKNYQDSFYGLLEEGEQKAIKLITSDYWSGVPNAGKWLNYGTLKLPPVIHGNIEVKVA